MAASFGDVIDRFAEKRVLVIGDAMLDSYCFGSSTRLCQEAPVPVVAVHERRDQPGGAANTALNLAALGCQVELLAVVGADYEGDRLRTLLQRRGVGTDLVAVEHQRQTLAKQRIVNGGQLVMRIDRGDTGPVSAAVERWLRPRLDAAFVRADAVIVSDYGYGVLTAGLLARLRLLQERFAQLVAVDARDMLQYRPLGATVVKPNYAEALHLVGATADAPGTSRQMLAAAISAQILERTGARIAAITLDADGAVLAERGQPPFTTDVAPADQSHTAGAGDTYLAALTLALAAGATVRAAAEIAAGAAAVVVAQEGTATCSADELRRAVAAAAPTYRHPEGHTTGALAGGDAWPAPAEQPYGLVTSRTARPLGPVEPADMPCADGEEQGSEGGPTDLGNGRATALHQA